MMQSTASTGPQRCRREVLPDGTLRVSSGPPVAGELTLSETAPGVILMRITGDAPVEFCDAMAEHGLRIGLRCGLPLIYFVDLADHGRAEPAFRERILSALGERKGNIGTLHYLVSSRVLAMILNVWSMTLGGRKIRVFHTRAAFTQVMDAAVSARRGGAA